MRLQPGTDIKKGQAGMGIPAVQGNELKTGFHAFLQVEKSGVNEKVVVSKRPLSLIFSSGITSRAMKERVMKGTPSVAPASFTVPGKIFRFTISTILPPLIYGSISLLVLYSLKPPGQRISLNLLLFVPQNSPGQAEIVEAADSGEIFL
jgi:hypothetical protein